MFPITRVLIRRGVVCRGFTATLIFYSALLAGSSPLQAAKTPERAKENRAPEGISASDWQSIRAAHEAWQHAIEPIKGGWQARNPAQQWTTKFDGRGFEAKPQSAEWTWGLELRSYGAGDEQREVSGKPEVKTKGHRLAYHWDETVQEWFVNDGRGLEHGFSVQERPPGPSDAPLTFLLATRGPLRAAVTGDARAVDYRDKSGVTVLTYSGLRVWDADGRELAARFAPAKDGVTLQVDAKDARYPLLIDPIAQQAMVKGIIAAAFGEFGRSAALSDDGNTMVVGGVDGAYVFVRNGSAWLQQAYLRGSNTVSNDKMGRSVAISSDTVVVGAPEEDGDGTTTDNDNATDAGAAYVFARNGTTWTQQAYLKASNTGAGDNFGTSVAISGSTVVVGAYGEDGDGITTDNNNATNAGAAYVFVRNGTTWSQQAYLKASNTGAGDNFGSAVAVSGDMALVGADLEDAAYVFVRNGSGWTEQTVLKGSNTATADRFGCSLAISGDTVVVGAQWEAGDGTMTDNNNAGDAGAAYVFVRSGTTWTQQAYLKASNTGAGDRFGFSVAISGDTVAVGAWAEDSNATGVGGDSMDNSASTAGSAYIFVRNGTTWTQQAYLKASNTGADDRFGVSVAISGHTAVVGANLEDGDGTMTDNNNSTNAGAVYIFTGFGPAPVITSATSAGGQVGSTFSYQMTATAVAGVDSYDATGLPAGLSIDTATGAITGTPTVGGTFSVTLSATNAGGTDTETLTLTITVAPALTGWDESMNGALSPDAAAPTVVTLASGANSIIGSVGGNVDDHFTFTIPQGLELVSYVLHSYASTDATSWLGLQNGSPWTAGDDGGINPALLRANSHFGTADVGQALLGISSSAPLPSGTYTVKMQQFGANSSYRFDLTLQAAAAPPTPTPTPVASPTPGVSPTPVPPIGPDKLAPALRFSVRPQYSKARSFALSAIVSDDRAPKSLSYRVKPPGSKKFLPWRNVLLGGSGLSRKWNTPLGLNKEGRWDVQIQAIDTAGNKSQVGTMVVIADRTKPTARITSPPSVRSRGYRLQASVADRTQLASVRYRLQAPNAKKFGPWTSVKLGGNKLKQTWSRPLTLPKTGAWQIELQSIDAASNASKPAILKVNRTK